MPLTEVAIRNARPGVGTKKLSDGGGLQLWLTPSGSRLWYLAYRHSGRQRKLAIGPYPDVALREARERREEAKRQLRAGIDPSLAKKAARQAAVTTAANTFGCVADELLAKKSREGKASATLKKTDWLLRLAKDAFGERPITAITAPDILALLRKLEVKGHRESARRARATIGAVFRYAIATARAENDPTQALKGALTAPIVRHRSAITEPVAFGALLRSIDGFTGQATTRIALQLLALLFTRPGELRVARWSEFDLTKAEWTVPAERTKMRRPHRVPLPKQALDLLQELQRIGDATGEAYLFPSIRTPRRPMSDGTLNAALRRLGYSSDEVSAHGFRATASTILNESGLWSVDAIEHALAHIDQNAVRRAYARGEHWAERVKMGEWWADRLGELRITRGSNAP